MIVEPLHRAKMERRGRRLEYATTAWNSTEAVVTITTGLAAHSLGLVAFGLDSCVEVFASLVVLWQMRRSGDTARSALALRLIAGSFGVLAVYLGSECVHGVIVHHAAQQTIVGLGMLAVTVAVMFTLASGKRRAGLGLDNRALLADASMTFIDGCLAVSSSSPLARPYGLDGGGRTRLPRASSPSSPPARPLTDGAKLGLDTAGPRLRAPTKRPSGSAGVWGGVVGAPDGAPASDPTDPYHPLMRATSHGGYRPGVPVWCWGTDARSGSGAHRIEAHLGHTQQTRRLPNEAQGVVTNYERDQ